MKVSIAMATYNGEMYLAEQLNSLINQTRKPDELIVSDDKSEDRTLQIIEEFKQKAPFEVRITVNKKNVGYTRNFENAISLTDGDLIFLCDQDDVWFSNKLEKMVQAYEDDPQLLIICNREHVDNQMRHLNDNSISRIKRLGLDINSYSSGCAMAFSKQLKEIALPIPQVKEIAYDTWLGKLSFLLKSKKIVKEKLQYYRCYNDSTSSHVLGSSSKITKTRYALDRFLMNIKKLSRGESYYQNQIRISSNYLERLDKKKKVIISSKILDSKDFEVVRNDLSNSINNQKKRYDLRRMSLFKRVPHVFRFYKEGLYNEFGGFMTAAKDIFKP